MRPLAVVAFLFTLGVALPGPAQDRLKSMPGYEQYRKMSTAIPGSVKSGAVAVSWKDGGKALEYSRDGTAYRYGIADGKEEAVGKGKEGAGGRFPGKGRFQRGGGGGGGGGVARGRQATGSPSPDGQYRAFYRDRNLWLSDAKGVLEMRITADGDEKARIKNGTASWVYGEELFQRSAMWWSPDGKKIAFYRFDEGKVIDYYLSLAQTSIQSKLDVEAYPKAGAPNPVVDLLVYDLPSKRTTRVDVRDGKPFEGGVVGHYVYNVSWSPDGKEVHFYRTNRRQDVMEFAAADPATGKCRVVVREEWPESWVENLPRLRYLKDNKRFVWPSQRTGWRNLYLYDLSGKVLARLTNHESDVAPQIVKIDEGAGLVWYMARTGDNPMKLQLHRVGLDGQGDKRLTDPAYHHTCDVSPDGKHFVDVAQTHDKAPVTRLFDGEGKVLKELAKSDLSKFNELGLKPAELLTFKAADGKADLYGLLYKPSNFDPNRKYPLLVSVYAGPETNGASETFATPNALTEYGFLVARFDSRSAAGRGKRLLDSIYMKLGITEVDDQAAGVRSLWSRPYLDKTRVGMFGSSYGGTVSAACLLRHPDVFQAACSSSPVTDYRNYDTIYAERYMRTPQENKAGYDAASLMTYAGNLRGRLMLYYGTADNNVHPANALQLVRALQRAGKSFEVQVGPDAGHSALAQPRMMEFFIESLVLAPR
ncbi:MAG: DPP IV N-terminal domain-containing protein [Gemmataceae bacterium]